MRRNDADGAYEIRCNFIAARENKLKTALHDCRTHHNNIRLELSLEVALNLCRKLLFIAGKWYELADGAKIIHRSKGADNIIQSAVRECCAKKEGIELSHDEMISILLHVCQCLSAPESLLPNAEVTE